MKNYMNFISITFFLFDFIFDSKFVFKNKKHFSFIVANWQHIHDTELITHYSEYVYKLFVDSMIHINSVNTIILILFYN